MVVCLHCSVYYSVLYCTVDVVNYTLLCILVEIITDCRCTGLCGVLEKSYSHLLGTDCIVAVTGALFA